MVGFRIFLSSMLASLVVPTPMVVTDENDDSFEVLEVKFCMKLLNEIWTSSQIVRRMVGDFTRCLTSCCYLASIFRGQLC